MGIINYIIDAFINSVPLMQIGSDNGFRYLPHDARKAMIEGWSIFFVLGDRKTYFKGLFFGDKK